MDLFGKKAKIAQIYAEAQLNVVLAWNADLEQRLDRSEAQRIVLQGALDRFQRENTNLKRKCDELLMAAQRFAPSTKRLYKSEEEEELEYALRNGDIDLGQFKDLMAEQGFENTEIEIPERPERPIVY